LSLTVNSLTTFSLNAYSPPFWTQNKGDIPAQGRNTPLTVGGLRLGQ
jgi:hypothetical protein